MKERGFEGEFLKEREPIQVDIKDKKFVIPSQVPACYRLPDCQISMLLFHRELLLIKGSGPNVGVHVLLMTPVEEFTSGSHV